MIIPIDTLSLFIGAAAVLALAPGPDNIFVLTHAALHGRRAGLFIIFGLCTGVVLHTVAIAFGLTVIFADSAAAFVALKIFGAGYLFYLSGVYLCAKPAALNGKNIQLSEAKLYTRGVIMNVSNPKVAIFFLAFFPQFTDPVIGKLGEQVIILGAFFILVTCFIFGGITWFAVHVGKILRKSRNAQTLLSRSAGLIFLALAVRLVFEQR